MKKIAAALMSAVLACVSVAALAADEAKKEDMSGKMAKKPKTTHEHVKKKHSKAKAKKEKPAAKADEMKK